LKRLLFYIVFLGLSLPAFAQQGDAYVSADSVTIGDRFELTVVLGHDGTRSALFPHSMLPDSIQQVGAAFGLEDFEILDVLKEGGRPYDLGGRIDSVVYEATTFALDTARVAGIPVGLASDMDTLVAMTPPVFLRIGSLVPEDAAELKDITPLADFDRSWWPWILGMLALCAIVFALWLKRRRDGEDESTGATLEPETPPYDEAVERLTELAAMDLSDPEIVKPFYVELTDILRTYVGRRARVPALESTTRELLDKLQRSQAGTVVPGEVLSEIDDVLSHADLVKFADLQPLLEKTRDMVTETRSAIEGAESALRADEEQRQAEERARLEEEMYAPPEEMGEEN
jgi:hypothetical protein